MKYAIMDYLRNNPNATIHDIANGVGFCELETLAEVLKLQGDGRIGQNSIPLDGERLSSAIYYVKRGYKNGKD